MKRFVGHVGWSSAAVLVGLVGLFYAFYALAALGAKGAVALGLPGFFGSAIVNAVTLMAVTLMTLAALLTVAERKWSAAMQDRIGANRIMVFGKFRAGRRAVPARRRAQDAHQGVHLPGGALQVPLRAGAGAGLLSHLRALRGHPGGSGGAGPRPDGGDVGRESRRRPALDLRAGRHLGLRHHAGRLGLQQPGGPARRGARQRPDDQLRGLAGPVARGRDDRLQDREPAADGHRPGRRRPRSRPGARAPAPAARLPGLLHQRLRRDQARAVRPARRGERDRRLLPRVLRA